MTSARVNSFAEKKGSEDQINVNMIAASARVDEKAEGKKGSGCFSDWLHWIESSAFLFTST